MPSAEVRVCGFEGLASVPRPEELSPALRYVESGHYFRCGPWPTQGSCWKLIISATVLNLGDILGCVAGLLAESGVHFEYVRDLATLRRLSSGALGYLRVGRCVVIHLVGNEVALVERLISALEPFRDCCPPVPGARHVGDGLPLYYRYEPLPEDLVDPVLVGSSGLADAGPAGTVPVPEGVADDLARFVRPGRTGSPLRSFLLSYPVIDAISQNGRHGVFRALSLASERYLEVVLKLGYPFGQLLPDGSDGCDLLRRELGFYRSLRRRGIAALAPELKDAFDDGRHVAVVLERVEGTSLLRRRLEGALRPAKLDACWSILQTVHDHGLFLGDAKLASFIEAADGRLVVLDFETAGVLGKDSPAPIRTFDLRNPRPEDPQAEDRQHLLASILYPYRECHLGPESRMIDLRSLAGRSGLDEVEQWALEHLRSELAEMGRDDR